MTELIILNSNLTVYLVLQNFPVDTLRPFSESLIKKGFTVNLPTAIQQMQVQSGPFAAKGSTTALAIAYAFRRIDFVITNNITSPHDNVKDVFSALNSIGYPHTESIERMDIQGNITIKIQGDNASTFVPNIVKEDFVKIANEIFEGEIKPVGIRLSTPTRVLSDKNDSFLILVEPLFNDPSDTKLLVQLTYSSINGDLAIKFLENLYDRLKKIIMSFKK